MSQPVVDSLADVTARLAVEDAAVRMFVATDDRDWNGLEKCFTDPFILDMTSMVGGTPVAMSPRQVATAWAEGFKALDNVHHQIGNLRTVVTGSKALVKCYGVALHHRKAAQATKSRIFVGTYDLYFTQSADHWLIDRLVFNLKFIDGNLELERGA